MKRSTRKYAKRQILWLRNKLLPAMYAANADKTHTVTYLLDATGKHAPNPYSWLPNFP
jgi:tRNA dimethylallyltransferase